MKNEPFSLISDKCAYDVGTLYPITLNG